MGGLLAGAVTFQRLGRLVMFEARTGRIKHGPLGKILAKSNLVSFQSITFFSLEKYCGLLRELNSRTIVFQGEVGIHELPLAQLGSPHPISSLISAIISYPVEVRFQRLTTARL